MLKLWVVLLNRNKDFRNKTTHSPDNPPDGNPFYSEWPAVLSLRQKYHLLVSYPSRKDYWSSKCCFSASLRRRHLSPTRHQCSVLLFITNLNGKERHTDTSRKVYNPFRSFSSFEDNRSENGHGK